jgi:hypothetical protein
MINNRLLAVNNSVLSIQQKLDFLLTLMLQPFFALKNRFIQNIL